MTDIATLIAEIHKKTEQLERDNAEARQQRERSDQLQKMLDEKTDTALFSRRMLNKKLGLDEQTSYNDMVEHLIKRAEAAERKIDALQECIDAQNREFTALAERMEYKGNSVNHWWAKAMAYRDAFILRDAAIERAEQLQKELSIARRLLSTRIEASEHDKMITEVTERAEAAEKERDKLRDDLEIMDKAARRWMDHAKSFESECAKLREQIATQKTLLDSAHNVDFVRHCQAAKEAAEKELADLKGRLHTESQPRGNAEAKVRELARAIEEERNQSDADYADLKQELKKAEANMQELEALLKQKGTACIKHDLVHGWACPGCLNEAESHLAESEAKVRELNDLCPAYAAMAGKAESRLAALTNLHELSCQGQREALSKVRVLEDRLAALTGDAAVGAAARYLYKRTQYQWCEWEYQDVNTKARQLDTARGVIEAARKAVGGQ